MMLYNRTQDPGKSWTRILSHSPPTLPSPVNTKKLQESRGREVHIWAKVLNWTPRNRSWCPQSLKSCVPITRGRKCTKFSNFWMKKCPILKRYLCSQFAITQHVAMHVGRQYDSISFCRIFLIIFYFPAERNPFVLDYEHDCSEVSREPGIPEENFK